jgi:hypothetical protein
MQGLGDAHTPPKNLEDHAIVLRKADVPAVPLDPLTTITRACSLMADNPSYKMDLIMKFLIFSKKGVPPSPP